MSAESLGTFLDAEPHGLNGPSGGGVELGADIQPPPRNFTPETDAQLKTFTSISKHKRHFTNRTGTVSAKFARKLEREERDEALAALRDIADTSQSTLERGREAHSPAQATEHTGVPERPDAPTPETDAKAVGVIGFYSCATVPADFARRLERERAALATKCKQLSSQLEDWQNFGKYSVDVIRMCVVAAYPEYRETMRRFAVLEDTK